ncbi:hypothetical protein FRB99_002911 [Tulasnella sp. 403]|nr:hypothetical protein FRB99_002911 [Tulasnella sp. 403]
MLRLASLKAFRATPLVRFTSTISPFPLRAASTLHRPSLNAIQPRKPSTLALVSLQFHQKRFAASTVAGRPASEDIPHAIQNAREEAKGVAIDIAKIIAAANFDKRHHELDGFSDITAGLAAEVPKPILITGLAGQLLIFPIMCLALRAEVPEQPAGLLAAGHASRVDYDTAMNLLEAATHIQVTYGAVLLSFIGAMHWGMEFSAYGGHQGYRRLLLGVAPVIAGWSTLALEPSMALVGQWVAFTAQWFIDARATEAGWTPIWYSQYRFYLSVLIGSCMMLTLWGDSFLNPVMETTTFARTTSPPSSNTPEALIDTGRFSGTSTALGDIETIEGVDYYVVLKHKGGEEAEATEGGDGEETADAQQDPQEEKEESQTQGKAGEIKSGTTTV